MHPVIRILCLLVLASVAPWLSPAALLAAGLLLLVRGLAQPATGRAMCRGVMRIRWLLLSLAVLYLWFSPGIPVWPALGSLSPTAGGLALAVQRAGLLLVLVLAATAFLGDLSPRQLSEALRRLLTWPVETEAALRFADRIGLLVAELPAVEHRLRASREGHGSFAMRAARLVEFIEASAMRAPEAKPALSPEYPPRWQWLLPIGLLGIGLVLIFLHGGA